MSHFEIVRTDAEQPWHARFRASNGRIMWTTETYTRRGAALNAIGALVDAFPGVWIDTGWIDDKTLQRGTAVVQRIDSWNKRDGRVLEIRDVDERAEVAR